MKKFTNLIIEQLHLFLGNTLPKHEITEQEKTYVELIDMIELALYRQSAIHVIYAKKKSFTGELVKWDSVRQQIIVKNFSKNLSAIIRLQDIQRISLVPNTIKQSQQKN